MKRKGFVSTMRKGFHMTFPNGLTASVQWGAGNYCDNHFPDDRDFSYSKDAESNTAEVAVIRNGELIDLAPFFDNGIGDEVAGYLSTSEVLDFLVKVRDWKEV